MRKVIVEIYLPVIDRSYDFILPAHISVDNIIHFVYKAVMEHEKIDLSIEGVNLFYKDENNNCHLLNNNTTLFQENVMDGGSLILV